MRTLIHLVRHAEVENPKNTWYGRLEGFGLSERGLRQAAALGEEFAAAKIAAIYSSPLTRTTETAAAIAEPHGLEVQIDPDIIESETLLQGKPVDRLFLNPMNLRYFLNPFRPSWGESYESIRQRMLRAIERMRTQHAGAEVIALSHMTPILVGRISIEGNRLPPWRARLRCARASVTTLEFEDDRHLGTRYEEIGTRVH
jgi:broad specificity phosphatase PhoE